MNGKKSVYLNQYCRKKNYSYLCFDFRGHGKSNGEFTDFGISDWYEDLNKLINFLKTEELEYQIVEFEDACSYIGKDTAQGTTSYYGEYEDLELKEKLEDLMNNHEFTKIWNT